MGSRHTWAAAIAVALAATAACGGGDDKAARPSTATFCADMAKLDQGGGDAGPYSAFYEKHADPTPADWAADGHLVTDAIQASIDDLSAVRPSKEAEPHVDDVLAALETVKQNSVDMSKAGEDGDQHALDALEKVNQDSNVPALMAAMQKVEKLCGAGGGS